MVASASPGVVDCHAGGDAEDAGDAQDGHGPGHPAQYLQQVLGPGGASPPPTSGTPEGGGAAVTAWVRYGAASMRAAIRVDNSIPLYVG
jgi:hypothetical protein